MVSYQRKYQRKKMLDRERLIIEIQARECIWNFESPLYHNRDVKRSAWIEVLKKVFNKKFDEKEQKIKIDELQKKWKNIRDQYKKSRKQLPSGSAKSIKPYIYSEMLNFLIPVTENRRSKEDAAISDDLRDSYDEDEILAQVTDVVEKPMRTSLEKHNSESDEAARPQKERKYN